jgi:lantibiotic modifying enzyme
MPTRRDALRTAAGAAILASAAAPARALERVARRAAALGRPSLEAALRAARWIHSTRAVTDRGVVWPADPRDPTSVGTTLYAGTPGVVLFLLELHAATGDRAMLDEAARGADHLAALDPAAHAEGAGLYVGLAGVAYTLEMAHRATRRQAYRDAARRAVAELRRRATPSEGGRAAWGETNDIVSGAAGAGLFLLWWARETADAGARAVAAEAGRELLRRGVDAPGGTMWRMDATFPRVMPNFSHGTAGVAYFLASLHRDTGDRAFLDAATRGARHLVAIATADAHTLKVHHNDSRPDLYYLSWCHGPAGTARLFHRLGQVTGDAEWRALVHRAAWATVASGVPEERSPGFWNNVSQCCGNAGVAEFFLDAYHAYRDPEYLAFARRVSADLMRRATDDAAGLRWVQAEHRVQPENLAAQTGLMQGAAGMGLWLLHLDAHETGRRPLVRLPDNPFGEA